MSAFDPKLPLAVDNYGNFDVLMKEEYEVWLRLQPLNDPDLLEAADWASLRQAYSDARALDERIKLNVG